MTTGNSLATLEKITRLVQSSLNPESLPSLILDLTREVIPYQFATLYMLDNLSNRLQAAAYVGREVNLIGLVNFELGPGVTAWVAKRRKPLVLSNIHRDRRDESETVRSFLSVPLIVEDEMVGVLNFGHQSAEAFDDLPESLLTVMGGQVAMIIYNVELVRQLRESHDKLREQHIEMARMQQQLLEKEKMDTITRMVTTLNHEINNPLTIIAGNVELLSAYLEGGDTRIQEKLNIIMDEVHRLGATLQQLANMQTAVVETYIDDREMINIKESTFLVG